MLVDVVPFPVPKAPAMMHPRPSIPIPEVFIATGNRNIYYACMQWLLTEIMTDKRILCTYYVQGVSDVTLLNSHLC